jgi:coniferyl-aldehyde dehydrogenase
MTRGICRGERSGQRLAARLVRRARTTFSALPFDHLVFTGSTAVGRSVMRAASENLVPATLELGGKSPAIVAKGHVRDQTVSDIVFGKLLSGGQTCIAPDYALVQESDVDAFVASYDRLVKTAYPDGPTSKDYTSIVNDKEYRNLVDLIEDARAHGARIIEVGQRPGDASRRPHTLAPTVVLGVTDDMRIAHEEIFGLILPVFSYRDINDAIDYVNARPRPLALYYFGADDADRRKVLNSTTSGNVTINGTIMHVGQDDLPFGGVGASGMGKYHAGSKASERSATPKASTSRAGGTACASCMPPSASALTPSSTSSFADDGLTHQTRDSDESRA